MTKNRLILTPPERRELNRRLRSRTLRVDDVRRAQVILRRAEGLSIRGVAMLLGCSTSYVQRWIKRFQQARLGGLLALHKGRSSSRDAAKREARILEWTRLSLIHI